MVKAFLGSTAVAAIVALGVGITPAYGETLTTGNRAPSLKIDGFTAVNTYVVNQQQRGNGKGGPQPHMAVDVSNLFFTIMGHSSSGIEYMYRITFETIPKTENIIDQNYVQIKSRAGTVQFGDVDGVEDTMLWDAGKIIGGTGGFDGGFNNVYNMSSGVIRGNDNIGDTGNATKFVYYTPEIQFAGGWQFGISYTPSTSHRGDSKVQNMLGSTDRIPGNRGLWDQKGLQPYDIRNVAIGLTYKKEVGKWNVTLSGAGITAKSYLFTNGTLTTLGRVPVQNTKAYQLGFVLGYGDFRFGGGYLDNGTSHLPRTPNFNLINATGNVNLGSMSNGNAGKAWNIGAGYTMGAYQLAASYQRSYRNTGNLLKANSDFYSATVDVTPLQGLKVYTEVDYIRSRTNSDSMQRDNQLINKVGTAGTSAIGNNSGLLGIVGTKISF